MLYPYEDPGPICYGETELSRPSDGARWSATCTEELAETGRGRVTRSGVTVLVTEWACAACGSVFHETRDDYYPVDADAVLFPLDDDA